MSDCNSGFVYPEVHLFPVDSVKLSHPQVYRCTKTATQELSLYRATSLSRSAAGRSTGADDGVCGLFCLSSDGRLSSGLDQRSSANRGTDLHNQIMTPFVCLRRMRMRHTSIHVTSAAFETILRRLSRKSRQPGLASITPNPFGLRANQAVGWLGSLGAMPRGAARAFVPPNGRPRRKFRVSHVQTPAPLGFRPGRDLDSHI